MTIKINMDMPKVCCDCRFMWATEEGYACYALSDVDSVLLRAKEIAKARPKWCPLEES